MFSVGQGNDILLTDAANAAAGIGNLETTTSKNTMATAMQAVAIDGDVTAKEGPG